MILIIALMLGSTLVAAGFLDKITGAFSFSSWLKPKAMPYCIGNAQLQPPIEMNYLFLVNQCLTIDGKTVKLVDVGDSSVVVEVSDTSDEITCI